MIVWSGSRPLGISSMSVNSLESITATSADHRDPAGLLDQRIGSEKSRAERTKSGQDGGRNVLAGQECEASDDERGEHREQHHEGGPLTEWPGGFRRRIGGRGL